MTSAAHALLVHLDATDIRVEFDLIAARGGPADESSAAEASWTYRAYAQHGIWYDSISALSG